MMVVYRWLYERMNDRRWKNGVCLFRERLLCMCVVRYAAVERGRRFVCLNLIVWLRDANESRTNDNENKEAGTSDAFFSNSWFVEKRRIYLLWSEKNKVVVEIVVCRQQQREMDTQAHTQKEQEEWMTTRTREKLGEWMRTECGEEKEKEQEEEGSVCVKERVDRVPMEWTGEKDPIRVRTELGWAVLLALQGRSQPNILAAGRNLVPGMFRFSVTSSSV